MSIVPEISSRQRVDEALLRMQALHPQLIDLSLPRIIRFLDMLDRPHEKVPPTIHVAGTNGKGSSVAYMRAVLEAAGHSVHAFTSPHLVRFNERIRLAGTLIHDDQLADLLDRCEAANQGQDITYFEITTAAAYLAFAETPADFLLLETGLGGRLDATNVIERPLACLITSISYDHERFLGDTIERIAFEKAGIIKPGVPVVIAPQEFPEAIEILLAKAEEVGAPALCHGRDWQVVATGDGFAIEFEGRSVSYPSPGLTGRHQFDNAAAAIMTLNRVAADRIDGASIHAGLANAAWPARLQQLSGLGEELPKEWQLWLDGGHNASAARALAAWSRARSRPLYLIVGILERKDAGAFFEPFADLAQTIVTVPVPSDTPSVAPVDLKRTAEQAGAQMVMAGDDFESALRAITDAAHPPGDIVICGSLYLAGAVLERLER